MQLLADVRAAYCKSWYRGIEQLYGARCFASCVCAAAQLPPNYLLLKTIALNHVPEEA